MGLIYKGFLKIFHKIWKNVEVEDQKRMIEKRKDNLLSVEARLTKDKVLFNQSVKDLADVVLDTDPMSVEQCAVAVYDAYLKWKNNRNN